MLPKGITKVPPRKLPPMKIPPLLLWIFPAMKAPHCENYRSENCPLGKFPPGKITPNGIPSPLINHTNERKNKIFCLEKTVQYSILITITKVLFDTQMIPQKILGFFYRMKKIQKSNESENHQVAFTCQLCKSRRTKTRQSNYNIWQTCETTKWPVKLEYHLVNFKKSE